MIYYLLNKGLSDTIFAFQYNYGKVFHLWLKIQRIDVVFLVKEYRGVLFEFHLKFWNTASICIPA